jgi:hypothetical protein
MTWVSSEENFALDLKAASYPLAFSKRKNQWRA